MFLGAIKKEEDIEAVWSEYALEVKKDRQLKTKVYILRVLKELY